MFLSAGVSVDIVLLIKRCGISPRRSTVPFSIHRLMPVISLGSGSRFLVVKLHHPMPADLAHVMESHTCAKDSDENKQGNDRGVAI